MDPHGVLFSHHGLCSALSDVVPFNYFLIGFVRLALLLPSHGHILRLESGSEAVTANDIHLSYCEGIRRITFKQWPHKNYMLVCMLTLD